MSGTAVTTLVTGSAGHLGEGLLRTLARLGRPARGIDIQRSEFTTETGSINDRALVRACLEGVDTVFHTATLHKPHVATHERAAFVETNIQGTLTLLEEAVAAGVHAFVFTSTTSTFGQALRPTAGTPACWVTEDTAPVPRNIYGVTKRAAEDLCQLIQRTMGLPCIVLRTSRFFPEEDDDRQRRAEFADANTKANEFLFRRVDLEDVVDAHLLAAARAPELGYGLYVISATTPFLPEDLALLNSDAPAVVERRVPAYLEVYRSLGWRMFDHIDRVYVNDLARRDLGWKPRHDFQSVLEALRSGRDPRSPLALAVGARGYHDQVFEDGPFPVID